MSKEIKDFINNLIRFEKGKFYYNRKPFNYISDWFEANESITEISTQALVNAGYMDRGNIIKEINNIKSSYEKGSSLDLGFHVAIGKVLRIIVDINKDL